MSAPVPSLSRRWGAVALPTLLAVLLAGGLAGCSGGGGASSSANGVAAGVEQQGSGAGLGGVASAGAAPAPAQAASGGASGASGSSGASAGSTASGGAAVAPARVVRTATLQLQVDDVTRSAAQVRAVADGAGGSVTQEDLSSVVDPGGPVPQPSATPAVSTAVQRTSTTGTMTVQVPQARLDGVVDQLAALGTVLQRTTSSQDVTSTYVDTASRVGTMQASVARLRTLLAQAKDLGQVVALEDELTKREADLESTQAQLADLQGRTTMSTVSLTLSTPATTTTPTPSGSPGFLDGLRGGWHAFVAAVVWLLAVLGAVLPFLALGAAVALPVVAWRRRRTPVVEAPEAPKPPRPPRPPRPPTRPTRRRPLPWRREQRRPDRTDSVRRAAPARRGVRAGPARGLRAAA